jgi:hypothetical protein
MSQGVRAGAARLRPLTDRRQYGRLKGTRLGCNIGTVIDLSGGGLRIRRSTRLSSQMDVKLWTAKRQITVPAKVAWVRRIGFRKYEVGLEFRDLSPDTQKDLSTFAAYLSAG